MEEWDELIVDRKREEMREENDEKARCYLQSSLPGEGTQLVKSPFLMIHWHDYCYENMQVGRGGVVQVRVET